MRTQDMDTKQVRTKVTGNRSFDQLIQSQTYEIKQQKIEQIMSRIAIQGERLSRFHSIENLVKFKRLVKGFLEETVYHGLHLQKSHQFSPEGRSQKLAIVKEIDEKLIELTE